jgi:hypothetical protein
VLVVLQNPVGLAAAAPKIATRLNNLLNTEEPWVKNLYLVADFDGVASAHAEVGQSLGSPGVRQVSASVDFGHLDAPTMLRYADRLLPKLLEGSRVEQVKVVFDDDARQVLGQVLATPNEPLDDLQPRLQQFILSHIDLQTSFDPETSVLKLSLAQQMKSEPKHLESLIKQLHQPLTDLSAGRALFSVDEVAVRPTIDETGVEVAWSEATAALRALIPDEAATPELRRLELAVEAMARQTDSARAFGWADRVTPRQYQTLVQRAELVGQAIVERYYARADELPDGADFSADAELTAAKTEAEHLQQLQAALAPLAHDTDEAQFAGQQVLDLMKELEAERAGTTEETEETPDDSTAAA